MFKRKLTDKLYRRALDRLVREVIVNRYDQKEIILLREMINTDFQLTNDISDNGFILGKPVKII